jgi:HAD superfamily hydrolase (TIGR01549 family)
LTRTIEAVVFDVGETLVDETRPWGAWADHLGVPRLTFFSVLGAAIADGRHHNDPIHLFRPGIDVEAERRRLEAETGFAFVAEGDLYPDAIDCLRALAREGYRLGVAANQPTATATVIQGLGIELELVAMSAEWGLHKPDPAFFERIARELELPPASIAYVGDRIDNDVRPALAAGMTAVFLRRGPWGWIQAGREDPPEADVVINSLAELPEALRSYRGRDGS